MANPVVTAFPKAQRPAEFLQGRIIASMLPGFRFLFAAIVLSTSILVFGLGAAAVLRAAHEEFAASGSWRPAPETSVALQNEQPVIAMVRIEQPDEHPVTAPADAARALASQDLAPQADPAPASQDPTPQPAPAQTAAIDPTPTAAPADDNPSEAKTPDEVTKPEAISADAPSKEAAVEQLPANPEATPAAATVPAPVAAPVSTALQMMGPETPPAQIDAAGDGQASGEVQTATAAPASPPEPAVPATPIAAPVAAPTDAANATPSEPAQGLFAQGVAAQMPASPAPATAPDPSATSEIATPRDPPAAIENPASEKAKPAEVDQAEAKKKQKEKQQAEERARRRRLAARRARLARQAAAAQAQAQAQLQANPFAQTTPTMPFAQPATATTVVPGTTRTAVRKR